MSSAFFSRLEELLRYKFKPGSCTVCMYGDACVSVPGPIWVLIKCFYWKSRQCLQRLLRWIGIFSKLLVGRTLKKELLCCPLIFQSQNSVIHRKVAASRTTGLVVQGQAQPPSMILRTVSTRIETRKAIETFYVLNAGRLFQSWMVNKENRSHIIFILIID